MSTTDDTDLIDAELADHWSAADDERPGEVLYPGENTIVTHGNHPLRQGEQIAVWAEIYIDGRGTVEACAELTVIGDDGEGDIFAVPADEEVAEISVVYRLASDLSAITPGAVKRVPQYDGGDLEIERKVLSHGTGDRLLEARRLGTSAGWSR